MIRRALISVSDKRGVVELAKVLAELGVEILSTGGTAAALAAAGVPVTQVSDYTGAPEILDGRVKTLHPKIHGGLLGRDTARRTARRWRRTTIEPIDLVVVNLYPFEATIARPTSRFDEAIENIDIGGPSMLRSAAKNHERVAVVVDPDDYDAVIAELRRRPTACRPARRLALARKAFAHTAAYDAAIAAYLSSIDDCGRARPRHQAPVAPRAARHADACSGAGSTSCATARTRTRAPRSTRTRGRRCRARRRTRPTIAAAEVLGGKQLSYNNILDLDAALGLVPRVRRAGRGRRQAQQPVRRRDRSRDRRRRTTARARGRCDQRVRRHRRGQPRGRRGARAAARRDVPRVRGRAGLLGGRARRAREQEEPAPGRGAAATWRAPTGELAWSIRTIAGGALVQTVDHGMVDLATAKVATKRAPTDAERADLAFAWRVAKHVKSNAIVFAKDGVTLAIGAGQMSRVDSVRICERKAGDTLDGRGRRVRRVLPVPRRRRRARGGRRGRGRPAGRLGARRRGDRRGRRARPRDGVHRHAPLPALAASHARASTPFDRRPRAGRWSRPSTEGSEETMANEKAVLFIGSNGSIVARRVRGDDSLDGAGPWLDAQHEGGLVLALGRLNLG